MTKNLQDDKQSATDDVPIKAFDRRMLREAVRMNKYKKTVNHESQIRKDDIIKQMQ